MPEISVVLASRYIFALFVAALSPRVRLMAVVFAVCTVHVVDLDELMVYCILFMGAALFAELRMT